MNRLINVSVAAIILLLLLGHMMTYTVRFNETVIVTTFGRAGAASVKNAPDGDGRAGHEAGLHFKLPWPIQQIARTYDTRVQVLEDSIEQVQTNDRQTVVISTYVAWRITDPLAFFTSLGNEIEAQNAIRNRVRASRGVIGRYDFDQLTNVDPRQLRLAEAELEMRRQISEDLDRRGYGITVEEVGIKRVVLPPTVNESVFSRMRAERHAIAERARSQGQTRRNQLIAEAQTTSQRIVSFAETRAARIVADGRTAAAEIVARFAEDEEFASFLIQLDAINRILGQRSRYLISPEWGAPFDLLSSGPNDPAPTTPTSPAPQADRGTESDGDDELPAGALFDD